MYTVSYFKYIYLYINIYLTVKRQESDLFVSYEYIAGKVSIVNVNNIKAIFSNDLEFYIFSPVLARVHLSSDIRLTDADYNGRARRILL